MTKLTRKLIVAGTLGLLFIATDGMARTTVEFGRITGVRPVDVTSGGAQTAGALVGGLRDRIEAAPKAVS